MEKGNYFVYITTNPGRSTLYTDVTNDLRTRLIQHDENRGNWKTFAGRYHCYRLIYYEYHEDINQAIEREKEIKALSRAKKEMLIASLNPEWHFYELQNFD